MQVPMLILSTAHYSKFWDDLEALVPIGQAEVKRPAVHDGIRSCLQKPVVHRLLKVSYLRVPQDGIHRKVCQNLVFAYQ